MIGLDTILKIGEKVLDRVLPDPAAKAEAQTKLLELAQKGELAHLEADVKRMEIEAKDRDSARGRDRGRPAERRLDHHPAERLDVLRRGDNRPRPPEVRRSLRRQRPQHLNVLGHVPEHRDVALPGNLERDVGPQPSELQDAPQPRFLARL